MKRKKTAMTYLLMLVLLLATVSPAQASDWYTYNYNYWGEETESPDAYSVTNVFYGLDFGAEVGHFVEPQGLFIIENHVFVVDTGNHRIVELQKVNGEYELVRVIYSVQVAAFLADEMKVGDDVRLTLNGPLDIFVLKTTPEERVHDFGEYLGELYVPSETPAESGDDAAGEDGEDVSDETPDAETEGDAVDTEIGETVEDVDAGVPETTAETPTEEDGVEDAETGEDGTTEGDGSEDAGTEGDGETEETQPSASGTKENYIAQELDLPYDIYIADTQNNRVLHCDYNLNVIGVIDNPQDETLSEDFRFLPAKLVVDNANRLYVQANGVNTGLMEFDKTGTFTSYVGANKVSVNLVDVIWRKLQTREQRARTVQFVPTEYNNLSLDSKGFIYVTTSTFQTSDLLAGTANPVRKLNSIGTDILIRNGVDPPIGDLSFGTAGQISGPSRFVDVIPFANDTYCCLDSTRGKLFFYDFQGNLLYAFGGSGSKAGFFNMPTAMDNLSEEVFLVVDRSGSITEFSMTDYGRRVNTALGYYKIGLYDESAEVWKEVLQYNGNYTLAYIGIGRALLRTGDYKEAMEYFKIARDDTNYSKAFQQYRKIVIEDNISYIVVILLILIIVPKVVRSVKKLRKEIAEA